MDAHKQKYNVSSGTWSSNIWEPGTAAMAVLGYRNGVEPCWRCTSGQRDSSVFHGPAAEIENL